MSDDWIRQQEVLIQEFLDGWSWEQVVSSWLSRISESPVSLESLFTRIEIHDPAAPVGRDHELSWWPASLVPEMYLRLQDHVNKYPGTVRFTQTFSILEGGNLRPSACFGRARAIAMRFAPF